MFSHFVEQYSHSVYSMIVRIVQSREDAEELSQDAFLKAFSKLETFKGDCSFSTWLFRIAYNTAISFVRKKKVILPAIDESIIETVSDEAVGTFFDEDENERRLQQLEIAIAQLHWCSISTPLSAGKVRSMHGRSSPAISRESRPE